MPPTYQREDSGRVLHFQVKSFGQFYAGLSIGQLVRPGFSCQRMK
jgi:hypothetical protein